MQETWDIDLIPGLGRYPGERHDNPLQYSSLGNPMDRGAWQVSKELDTIEATWHVHTLDLFSLLKRAFPLASKHSSSLVFLPTRAAPCSCPPGAGPLCADHTHTHTHTRTSSRDLALELWTHTSECLLDAFTLLSYSHGNSANPQQNLGSFCHLLLSRYSGVSWTLSLPPDSSGSQFWGFL